MSQYDEGHTIAGWTGFGIATVGTAVAGAGICLVSAAWIAGGLAITVVSLLVTWALHLTGWGKGPGPRPRDQWGMRVRDASARGGHAQCWGCRLAGRGRWAAAARGVVPATVGGAGGTGEAGGAVGQPEPAGAEAGR